MRIGSVCSGIGCEAVAWAPIKGWQHVFFSEVAAFPRAVLKHRFPDVPLHGDFTTIERDTYGAIDLLVGGTPCQSFSVAGQRGGVDDHRGDLAYEFLALARRTRPQWIVWENVPGVLSIDGGRFFGTFLAAMGGSGYGFAYRVLDAQYVRIDGFPRAVPQRRRRLFVVGCLGSWQRAAAVLLERESLQGHPAPRRTAGQGTAHDTAPSLTGSGRGVERAGESRGQDPVIAFGGNNTSGAIDVATACNASGGPHGRLDFGTETFVAHSLTAEGFDAWEDGTGRGPPLTVSHTLNHAMTSGATEDGTGRGVPLTVGTLACNTGSHANAGGQVAVAFAENSRAEVRLEGGDGATVAALKTGGGKPGQSYPAVAFDILGVPATNGAAETDVHTVLRSRAPGASEGSTTTVVQQAAAVRRLTPRECERLQGLPDDHTLIPWRGGMAADGPRYKAIGNGMAVNVVRWIGRRIELVEALTNPQQLIAAE